MARKNQTKKILLNAKLPATAPSPRHTHIHIDPKSNLDQSSPLSSLTLYFKLQNFFFHSRSSNMSIFC